MTDYRSARCIRDRYPVTCKWVWKNGIESTLKFDKCCYNEIMLMESFINCANVSAKSIQLCANVEQFIRIHNNRLLGAKCEVIYENYKKHADEIMDFMKHFEIFFHGYNLYLYYLTKHNPEQRIEIIAIKGDAQYRWGNIICDSISNPMDVKRFEEYVKFINPNDGISIKLTHGVSYTQNRTTYGDITNIEEAKEYLYHIEMLNDIRKDFPEDVFSIYYQKLFSSRKKRVN